MAHVRISEGSKAKIVQIARETGQTMQSVLEQAVETYRRQLILDASNAAYRKLRRDRTEWSLVAEERHAWETTTQDGMEE